MSWNWQGIYCSLERVVFTATVFTVAGSHSYDGNPSHGSILVNRMSYSDSPITRSAPDDEVFTIFMPNNDVVEAGETSSLC